MIEGTQPIGDVILTSCDSNYFKNFAVPLVYSANENDTNLHVHVINPDEEDFVIFEKMKSRVNIDLTLSYEKTRSPVGREYYSCNRFMIAPLFLEKAEKLLIIDTDCLIMKKLVFPKTDYGLFLRDPLPNTNEWETEGSRVAAGIVYFNKTAIEFATLVRNILLNNQLIWFIDQRALWEAHKQFNQSLTYQTFDNNDMDWEFVEGTTIWTGKGNRKYTDQKYLTVQQKFRDMNVS
jgi:hypothetical protein